MGMFSTAQNGSGKFYDPVGRFRVVIDLFGTVESRDDVMRVLHRMRSGTVVVYSKLEDAIKAQGDFLGMARYVAQFGVEATYGVVSVVDIRDSLVHNSEAIMELKDKTVRVAV